MANITFKDICKLVNADKKKSIADFFLSDLEYSIKKQNNNNNKREIIIFFRSIKQSFSMTLKENTVMLLALSKFWIIFPNIPI